MATFCPPNRRGLRQRAPVIIATDLEDVPRRTPRTLAQAFPESEGFRFAFHGPDGPTWSERMAARFWRLLGLRS